MKRPPILIIINLLLLSAGYVYCSYLLIEGMIHHCVLRGINALLFIPLSFMTLCIIGAYIAVFKRQARSIALLGAALSLSVILLIPGIIFLIWSALIFDENSSSAGNLTMQKRQKYKYWLYSALTFCASGIFFGMAASYFRNQARTYESISKNMYSTMYVLLLAGVVLLVIYYILSKIRDSREKKTNCPEKTGTENP